MKYSLSGIGADQPPLNLFVVNRETGYVTVTGILDREEYQQFHVSFLCCKGNLFFPEVTKKKGEGNIYTSPQLTAYARFPDGSLAESKIDLNVVVLDQNDNPPVFQPMSASVRECSQVGKKYVFYS